MRNSQLEEECIILPKTIDDLNASNQRIEVLLVLLGEKEEELEGLLGDMKEIKNMYKNHMEDLLDKITPDN
jgi:hypothetical protein